MVLVSCVEVDALLAGTVSGLVSGLIVAFTVAAVTRLNRRRFELRKIGDNDTAVLVNQGWMPVLLGNTLFLNSAGEELRQAADPEIPIAQSFLKPNDDLVVCLGGRPAGSTVFFTYRPTIWFPHRRKRLAKLATEAREIGPFLTQRNRPRHWKECTLTVTL